MGTSYFGIRYFYHILIYCVPKYLPCPYSPCPYGPDSETLFPGPLHGPYPAAHTVTRKNPVLQRNLKGEQHAVRRKGDRELSFRNKSPGYRLYAFHR